MLTTAQWWHSSAVFVFSVFTIFMKDLTQLKSAGNKCHIFIESLMRPTDRLESMMAMLQLQTDVPWVILGTLIAIHGLPVSEQSLPATRYNHGMYWQATNFLQSPVSSNSIKSLQQQISGFLKPTQVPENVKILTFYCFMTVTVHAIISTLEHVIQDNMTPCSQAWPFSFGLK